jgi:hypothetical protein
MRDVARAALREIVCPVMWAELVSIAIFIGGMLVLAALFSGA